MIKRIPRRSITDEASGDIFVRNDSVTLIDISVTCHNNKVERGAAKIPRASMIFDFFTSL